MRHTHTRRKLNTYVQYYKKPSTTLCQDVESKIVSSRRCNPPAASSASFPTSEVQASLGLPTLRTNLSTAGFSDPGQNVTSRIRSPSFRRATLPYSSSCCFCNIFVIGFCPVVSRTRRFEILEIKAGLMVRSMHY